jgi:hypothetical protein
MGQHILGLLRYIANLRDAFNMSNYLKGSNFQISYERRRLGCLEGVIVKNHGFLAFLLIKKLTAGENLCRLTGFVRNSMS